MRSHARKLATLTTLACCIAWTSVSLASPPVMKHTWNLHRSDWNGACSGKRTSLLTHDRSQCLTAVSLGWSGDCDTGWYDADHYVSSVPFEGDVKVYRLAKVDSGCGACKDVNIVTADYGKKLELQAQGWSVYETFYAWDASGKSDSWYDEWGLIPIWHGYSSSRCDNLYSANTTFMNSYYSNGYSTGFGSEETMTDPHDSGDWRTKSVVYAAADGWLNLRVKCSGYSNCSWRLVGPGGWDRYDSGYWSQNELPTHRYKLYCDDVSGMTNVTPYQHTASMSYFQTETLYCTYECQNECSYVGQPGCSGSGYRVCQEDSNGCLEWGSTQSCNDGNPCTSDYCSGGSCQHSSTSGSCSDDDACTVGDYCSGGWCQSGSPKDCNDGNPCTSDYCSGGSCQHSPTGGSCNDGDPCTTGDACVGTSCEGTAMDCNDGNVCTSDYCSGGACQHPATSGSCDDDNACTTSDSCQSGACTGGPALDCNDGNPCTADSCDPASGCVHTAQGGACEDGNACTVDDQCSGGTCAPGSSKSCNDGNPCTDDWCDPAAGCQHADNTLPCDDGKVCTTSDACSGGQCVGTSATDCDDGVPCTTDTCVEGQGCSHEPLDTACDDENGCTDDSCNPTTGCEYVEHTESCSDGNPCTVGDVCDSGVCVPGGPKTCDDGIACTQDSCEPASGCVFTTNDAECDDGNVCTSDACDGTKGCVHPAAPGACDDHSACTTDDQCSSGECLGGPAPDCDDGNPCTADSCDPEVGCTHAAQPGACEDGDACTVGDQCSGGACVSGTVADCDDDNPCTDDSCDPTLGCQHEANTLPCDDGKTCTGGDVCAGGACAGTTQTDCDDGVPCTLDECVEGVGCTHTPTATACDDDNPCTHDSCDPASGCVHEEHTEACSDGNPCTVGDACDSGKCIPGSAKDCDDGIACTTDGCDIDLGCFHEPVDTACDDNVGCTEDQCHPADGCLHVTAHASCDDADPCTDDACNAAEGCAWTPGALDCDDENPCTTDSCVTGEGCENAPNELACDDGNPCTAGDVCNGGSCVSGVAKSCDDGNPCTVDFCDSSTGCVHEAQGGTCDDGNACTTTDVCVDGECVGDGAPVCNDGDPCTENVCDPELGCTYPEANGVACSDGDPCTVDDVCDSGKCLGGGSRDCDDGVACTQDGCAPDSGCTHSADDSVCDDGVACTTDTCHETNGCQHSPDADACTPQGPCDAPTCDPVAGCEHGPNPELCDGSDDPCQSVTCEADFTCQATPKDCDDGEPCTTDTCNPATGGCEHEPIAECCETDADCPQPSGCNQSQCVGGSCLLIEGCLSTEACAFGACRATCNPTKENTKCSTSATTLFECKTDPETQEAGWLPKECSGTDKCAFNEDLNRFHCCTPSCEGRECGAPSECMIPCGTCEDGWSCAGPNEAVEVPGTSPDAFTCVPGCRSVAEDAGVDLADVSVEVPACGPSLAGTVGLDTCPQCSGSRICEDGRCRTPCELRGRTDEGRCVGSQAVWCEDDIPQTSNCPQDNTYCCVAGVAENDTGHASCCSCELECEQKGWECGERSCGDGHCGDPDTDDGCPAGYDCTAKHECRCQIPALCGDVGPGPRAEYVEPVPDAAGDAGLDAAGGGDAGNSSDGGGGGLCSGASGSAGSSHLAATLLALALLLVRRRRHGMESSIRREEA